MLSYADMQGKGWRCVLDTGGHEADGQEGRCCEQGQEAAAGMSTSRSCWMTHHMLILCCNAHQATCLLATLGQVPCYLALCHSCAAAYNLQVSTAMTSLLAVLPGDAEDVPKSVRPVSNAAFAVPEVCHAEGPLAFVPTTASCEQQLQHCLHALSGSGRDCHTLHGSPRVWPMGRCYIW
jgi:hypothetical protein